MLHGHADYVLPQAPVLEPAFQLGKETEQLIDDVCSRPGLLTQHNAPEERTVLTEPAMRPCAFLWLQATGEGTHIGKYLIRCNLFTVMNHAVRRTMPEVHHEARSTRLVPLKIEHIDAIKRDAPKVDTERCMRRIEHKSTRCSKWMEALFQFSTELCCLTHV